MLYLITSARDIYLTIVNRAGRQGIGVRFLAGHISVAIIPILCHDLIYSEGTGGSLPGDHEARNLW
jgi:hypothetical protein